MHKDIILTILKGVGLGVALGYFARKIMNVNSTIIPEDIHDDTYKESNIEDVDDTETVCEATDPNAAERERMQKELLGLKRFRATYIKDLDDTKLTILYNLACK